MAKRALISVFDKTSIGDFAKGLVACGWELLASGGTAQHLTECGLEVTKVEELTGYPSILDGRVKTLHPAIFGGILADKANSAHVSQLAEHNIGGVDMVVCGLYPFASQPSIDMIDVGGPAMIRAAAKNYSSVIVVSDPSQYSDVLEEIKESGDVAEETRQRLSAQAFNLCIEYDIKIAEWLGDVHVSNTKMAPNRKIANQKPASHEPANQKPANLESTNHESTNQEPTSQKSSAGLPEKLTLVLNKVQDLRYGENPGELAALYQHRGGVPTDISAGGATSWGWWNNTIQHSGKQLSYLNMSDAEAAWSLVQAFAPNNQTTPNNVAPPHVVAVIVKHASPCGVSLVDSSADPATQVATLLAFQRAWDCDPVSAFGGVVALGGKVGAELATEITDKFIEVLIAPEYSPEALEILAGKKNLRVLDTPPPANPEGDPASFHYKSMDTGLLVRTPNRICYDLGAAARWEVVTNRSPTPQELKDLAFAWVMVAAVHSNAVVMASNGQAVGIGAGQQNRRDSVMLAAAKADGRAQVCAGDAFFPFRDGLDLAAEAGCTAVVQPGGSVRDEEVIAAANEHKMAMLFTHQRCFSH